MFMRPLCLFQWPSFYNCINNAHLKQHVMKGFNAAIYLGVYNAFWHSRLLRGQAEVDVLLTKFQSTKAFTMIIRKKRVFGIGYYYEICGCFQSKAYLMLSLIVLKLYVSSITFLKLSDKSSLLTENYTWYNNLDRSFLIVSQYLVQCASPHM